MSAVNRGESNPMEHLAKQIGKSASTVKGHLWQARKKDLLTGSAGARVGNSPTELQRSKNGSFHQCQIEMAWAIRAV